MWRQRVVARRVAAQMARLMINLPNQPAAIVFGCFRGFSSYGRQANNDEETKVIHKLRFDSTARVLVLASAMLTAAGIPAIVSRG
jgi:hypothetical protein